MRAIADTGPLLAGAVRTDEAHVLASSIITELGSDLLVPDPVMVEVDHMLRARVGSHAARAFLRSLVEGELAYAQMTPGLVRRACELDRDFADLEIGYADASVMAIAERSELPILTFDFTHFRATRPAYGYWQLVVDEARHAAEVGK